MIADRSVMTIIAPLRSCCSACLDICRNKSACEKIVTWSIVQSCGEYEQWEGEGSAEMAEFSAGLQKRQGERYVISLFFYFFWGEVLWVFHDICAGHSPSNHEKLACALIRVSALNRANMVVIWHIYIFEQMCFQLFEDCHTPSCPYIIWELIPYSFGAQALIELSQ